MRHEKGRGGAPGVRAAAVAIAGLGSLVLAMATPGVAAPPEAWQAQYGAAEPRPGLERSLTFSGQFHSVGQLLLHVSNMGVFGRFVSTPAGLLRDEDNPSAEWPAGSGNNYLWSAGLWVGALRPNVDNPAREDTLVTAAVYQAEFWPNLDDEVDVLYRSYEGRPGGGRDRDDDGDGLVDEERLDGRDNDGDGSIDEDYDAISQDMFACTYYDTAGFINAYISDPLERHHPLNLKIFQESYQWTGKRFDDFVGVHYEIVNISLTDTLRNVYIGFMTDADCGPDIYASDVAGDDQTRYMEVDTTFTPVGATSSINVQSSMAYIYDEVGGDDQSNANAALGVLFLNHTTDPSGVDAPAEVRIHAYNNWSIAGEDPQNDGDRYRYLRGASDAFQTIDEDTERPQDYRFLVSAGKFARILPLDTLQFEVAFAAGPIERNGEIGGQPDISGLLENAIFAQVAFDNGWRTASPPPPPNQQATAGDRKVVVEWDNFPETVPDPLTTVFDFAGYQIWKAVGWDRTSTTPSAGQWRLIADIPRSRTPRYETGLRGVGQYRLVDTDVHNGFPYWYAVTAYDNGAGQQEGPLFGGPSQAQVLVWPRSGSTKGLDSDAADPASGRRGKVRVVPNPYKESERWDLAETDFDPSGRRICFMNLPEQATIRIFTESGDLVEVLEHDRGSDVEGETCWNLVSRNNQIVVSGIYIYHVETPVGETIGKFAVIR